mmetsp:Transcript_37217/g.82780  ORF Transcript_37217/g.82780 Transcript_37217/m.82780 type:complete len:744 (-) Transcript_37217:388-2619(-)
MSLRGKEFHIILLDVGRDMHQYLDDLQKTLFVFMQTKILNQPAHEVALILYGSTDTKNSLFQEFAAQDVTTEYCHIYVLQELKPPGLDTLCALSPLPRGTGTSDFVDALTVAVDMLNKACEVRAIENAPKKVTIISNFRGQTKELDDEFREQLVGGMQRQKAVLQVVSLDNDAEADRASANKVQNLSILESLVNETGGKGVRSVREAAELLGIFRTKEVSFACVKAELEIGRSMRIRTRVYKKSGFERLPTLKTRSTFQEGLLASVMVSVEHFLAVAPAGEGAADGAGEQAEGAAGSSAAMSEPVGSEEIVKAFRYGKQYVPVDSVTRNDLEYKPGKMMQLVGCMERQAIQRHYLLGDPQLVLPEQDEASQVALSALVKAMESQQQAAVVRFARTPAAKVSMCLLVPELGTATIPDHFIMTALPFAEDIRAYTFPPLVTPDTEPNDEQNNAAGQLVAAMSLLQNGRELLAPEETANPTLQRFYYTLGKVALRQEGLEDIEGPKLPEDPESDKLVQAVLEPPLSHLPASAPAAMSAFSRLFKTQEVKAEAKRPHEQVAEGANDEEARERKRASGFFGDQLGTAADGGALATVSADIPPPTSDEEVEHGVVDGRFSVEAAVKLLGVRTLDLVEKSVGNRSYPRAKRTIEAMRRLSIAAPTPSCQPFNDFLRGLKDRFKGDDARGDFWLLVQEGGISLISSREVASSGVEPEEADAFLAQPAGDVAAAAPAQQVAEDDQGEFDDMD